MYQANYFFYLRVSLTKNQETSKGRLNFFYFPEPLIMAKPVKNNIFTSSHNDQLSI